MYLRYKLIWSKTSIVTFRSIPPQRLSSFLDLDLTTVQSRHYFTFRFLVPFQIISILLPPWIIIILADPDKFKTRECFKIYPRNPVRQHCISRLRRYSFDQGADILMNTFSFPRVISRNIVDKPVRRSATRGLLSITGYKPGSFIYRSVCFCFEFQLVERICRTNGRSRRKRGKSKEIGLFGCLSRYIIDVRSVILFGRNLIFFLILIICCRINLE